MTSKKELVDMALALKDKRGVQPIKEILSKHLGPGNHKLSDVPEDLYSEVMIDLQGLNGNRVMGYAHNSNIAPSPFGERPTSLPSSMGAQYGGVKLHRWPVESLTMTALQVNRTIETREDAIAAVKELQEKWDLIDDNTVLRQLMDKMEERHGEEFNAFFAATIRQIMVGSGMTELRIDTSAVLLTLAQSAPLRVREAPGYLIYELVEDADV